MKIRKMELSGIRKEYNNTTLDMSTVDKNPVAQFEKWFKDAVDAQIAEPNAMNLATISTNGRPTSRIVLLKGIEDGKFIFYTNYQSQKGYELEKNPACALTFFWPEIERQVRIEGVAERVSAEASDTYFKSRPRGSQVGAWASPQSSIIKDREILEQRAAEIEKRFAGQQFLPRPKQWGGYGVTPYEIEFWQGRPNRLHDRILYSQVDGAWKINRLAP